MTTLREAATLALQALEGWNNYGKWVWPESALEQAKRNTTGALTALRSALAEYDKDRVKVEEMKANWALQRKLAQETEERDRQRREYEEQRLVELAEPTVPSDCADSHQPVAWYHVPYPGNSISPMVSLSQQHEPSMYGAVMPLYLKEQL